MNWSKVVAVRGMRSGQIQDTEGRDGRAKY